MFERFTDRARRSIVLAQDEARRLHHNYIGTEHLLLGLLSERDGVAARAVSRFGLTLAAGREDVLDIIGAGSQEVRLGHIPFTPRAKKCLELALREALQLGHDYIGTEHVLLGIIREGAGVGAQMLLRHAATLGEVRAAVIDLLPQPIAAQRRSRLQRLGRQRSVPVRLQPEPPEPRTTPAVETSLAEAARLAGPGPLGSHHILLAALADRNSAAARAMATCGIDLDQAQAALRAADVTGSSDELPEEAGRRQMVVTVTDDRLTIEAADPDIIQLGHAAAKALRTSAGRQSRPGDPAPQSGAPGTTAEPGPTEPSSADRVIVRGDHPLSASLGLVWLALRDSLEDIRHRAAAEAADASAPSARAAGETSAPAKTPPPTGTPPPAKTSAPAKAQAPAGTPAPAETPAPADTGQAEAPADTGQAEAPADPGEFSASGGAAEG